MPTIDPLTSRRHFLQFLASSPFYASSTLAAFAAENPSRLPDPMIWAPRDLDHLIAAPKEASSVFDFEPVMHKNVPPGHFGYMASGLDDEVPTSVEDGPAARGQPIWYQLYASNKFEVAKHHVQRAEKAGALAVAVTVDRSGGRNQETLFRMQRTDPRQCSDCHDNSTLANAQISKPMYDGGDLSG